MTPARGIRRPTHRSRALPLVAALLCLGLAASPAAAVPSCGLPPVIDTTAPEPHPEGVTWDPGRQAFLVGSVRHGTVSVVRPDGTVTTLVDDGVMVTTIGVHADPARNRVLVAYQDPGVGTRTDPSTFLQQSGVGIFDLTTGTLLHRVDLSDVPGGADYVHGANDLAVAADGTAYVTDIAAGELYRVTTSGDASLLLQDDRLGRDGVGPNGIVWHPHGYLLVVRYDTGTLWRVPVDAPEAMTEVELDVPVVAGDGMLLRPDGTLVVMRNHLASTEEGAVTVLRSRDGWRTAATVREVRPWPEENPTTATLTPSGTYVIEGRLGSLFAGDPSDELTIRRLDG
jgi:sugar lactone lactonase YvrE